jgi:O-antigen ligase
MDRRDRTLRIAAMAFLAANLVHLFDHWRTGTDRLTAEVSVGGAFVTLAAVATVWVVWRRSSRAPIVAALVGLWAAVLVAQAHFAPHWSALSDSYLDLSLDGFSWFAAAAEMIAAGSLAVVGLRQLQADRRGVQS